MRGGVGRIAGWADLIEPGPAATVVKIQVKDRIRHLNCAFLLSWLACGGAWAFTAEVSPAAAPSAGDSEAVFFAPFFLSSGFTREARRQMELLRIERERETMVYRDFKRGLMWPTRDNGRDLDWKRAGRYCDDLALAGYQDWRLPEIEQLEGLHQKMAQTLYKTPRQIQLTACCPWSSTRSGDNSAWNFSFRFRKRFSGTLTYSYELRALCVRPMAAEEMAVDKKTKKAVARAARGERVRGGISQ